MEIKLDHLDVQMIAEQIYEMLKPVITPINTKVVNEIMNVKELAEYLKVETTWVYKQVQFKSVPHFHAGKYPRFKRKEIECWIKDQSIPSASIPYPKLRM
jgi:excisionase family DNA binding protein